MSGSRIVAPPVSPDEQPPASAQTGSNIQAAAGVLAEKNEMHNEAVKTLAVGGQMRRRNRSRKLRGGADVTVKNPPQFVSAGGVNPNNTFADLLQTGHAAKAAAVYDDLGDKPPINMNSTTGGRRRGRKRSSVKRNNGTRKRTTLFRSRRTRRGSRRVRNSRH